MLILTICIAVAIVLNCYATARLFDGRRGDTYTRQRTLLWIWALPFVGFAMSLRSLPNGIPVDQLDDILD